MRCDDCSNDLDHCHATVVVHAWGGSSCPECGGRPALHEWRQPCSDPCCGNG